MKSNGHAQRYYRDVVMTYDGDDCLIWPYSTNSNGYGLVCHDGRVRIVSRILCEDTNGGPPSSSHEAAHSCGRGHSGCVNRKHVRWATRTENQAERALHGRNNHSSHKLSEDDRLKIISLMGKLSQTKIAAEFGITQSYVSQLKRLNDGARL